MVASQFDGPIPGQSLTHAPGSTKWEKPPQFTNVDKAMDFLIEQTLEPRRMGRLMALIDNGVTIENLTQGILLGGFTEGKWNMDLGVNLIEPLMGWLATAYHQGAGKKPKMSNMEDKADPELAKLMRIKAKSEPKPEPIVEEPAGPPKTGLMGMQ